MSRASLNVLFAHRALYLGGIHPHHQHYSINHTTLLLDDGETLLKVKTGQETCKFQQEVVVFA